MNQSKTKLHLLRVRFTGNLAWERFSIVIENFMTQEQIKWR